MLQHAKTAMLFASSQQGIRMPHEFRASRDVVIRTADFPAATRFYENVLGLKIALRAETLVGFETGSFRLYVEPGTPHGPVFDFLVPDLQAAKAALLAAGCLVIEENPQVPRCYIRDPFGLTFNIEQRAPLLA
jgi:catechol 2,3-dioxygenase-like lactoylglutathione lyase family enzyme